MNAATAAGATDEELLGEARKLLSRKGSAEEQEAAPRARLEKFEKLAAIGEGGERDNAEAMAAQARAKLEELADPSKK